MKLSALTSSVVIFLVCSSLFGAYNNADVSALAGGGGYAAYDGDYVLAPANRTWVDSGYPI